MFKNCFSVGYSPVAFTSISPTGNQSQAIQRCLLAEVRKIRVPDRGRSSFLGDMDYYSPVEPGTQALLASLDR